MIKIGICKTLNYFDPIRGKPFTQKGNGRDSTQNPNLSERWNNTILRTKLVNTKSGIENSSILVSNYAQNPQKLKNFLIIGNELLLFMNVGIIPME